eukprot:TRINITY_DN9020_c0_g2_i2.p1 TRINITY_DN9020_c0_g2~~TRINITY_DN9020_c0_g2_i2.p1  ORF type:complete len:152 (+),score=24.13 TRINITY_DN9020_c0_g2_i2:196-651(+)
MMLPVLGVATPSAEVRARAIDLGVAIQLTNILRDVGYDASNLERIYLPREDLKRFQCSEADIVAQRVTPEYKSLTKFQLVRTRGLYDSARKGAALLPGLSKLAVLAIIQLLSSLLEELESREYDNLSAKIRLSTSGKVKAVLAAIFQSVFP